MANRYWVGGSGTWDSSNTTNWSATSGGAGGASVPVAADIAFLDANSGAVTVTLGYDATVLRLTCSGFTGTLDFSTFKVSIVGNGAAVFTASNAMLALGSKRVELTYAGSTGTRSISTGIKNKTNAINFYVTAGTDIVSSIGYADTLNFTGFSGTLSQGARSIFGDLVISSGMTLDAGTGVQTFGTTSGTQQITTAGKTFDFPLTFNGVGGTFAFQDALTQGSTRAFTITNGTVQLKNGVTSTVGSFVANNANVKFLQSTTSGSQATLSQASGTVNVADLTIQDINAVGGASWNAYTDFENTDAGNNDGWNFSLSPPYSTAEFPITLRSFTQPRRF
jgi:hypothetical protein